MARSVFFSFHFMNDVWRANQVRNGWVTQGKLAAGYIDSAEFEKIRQKGDSFVKKWIDEQLFGTSVTVVLIGRDTSKRDYVKYELQKSVERGNAIIGIYIHNLKDKDGNISSKGETTFGELGKDKYGEAIYYYQVAKTYDYVMDGGYQNLGSWIEEAAKVNGK